MRILILIASFMLSNLVTVPLEPVYSSVNTLFNLVWSADSTSLYFQDDGYNSGVDLSGTGWIIYNIESSKITRVNRFPLQPNFPQEVKEKMGLLHQYPNGLFESIIVTSPKGTFGLYTAVKQANWNGWGLPLGIINLKTNEFFVTDISLGGFDGLENGLRVLWSRDESAFAVTTENSNSAHFIYYANNFKANLRDLKYSEITRSRIKGELIDLVRVEAISDNGKYVFLRAYNGLLQLDIQNIDNSKIMADDYISHTVHYAAIGISFFDRTGNIVQISPEGKVTKTQSLTIARYGFNLLNFQRIVISPDGKYIALAAFMHTITEGDRWQVFVYPVT